MQTETEADGAHLPLVGEVARPAQREVISAGDHHDVFATQGPEPVPRRLQQRAPSPGQIMQELWRGRPRQRP